MIVLERLTRKLLKGDHKFPENISIGATEDLEEKVIQFGEGNFLRGFCDYMINKMNQNGYFNGSIVVVQPIAQGLANMLNEQDGLYTHIRRGIENGKNIYEVNLNTSISRAINPYDDFKAYLDLAHKESIRFIISNTTEAGIVYDPSNKFDDAPPASFPGKLTVLLHERYKACGGDVNKGFVILSCELIDNNGAELKKCVHKYIDQWNLGEEFKNWVDESTFFASTLVDRIVTGYPRDEVAKITEELGYDDHLIDTSELFGLWAIEAPKKFAEEIPFHKVGLNVVWTDDVKPYKLRKVRVLNATHTMTVLASFLSGKDTVGECVADPLINTYMKKGLYEEAVPLLTLPRQDVLDFADAVFERFSNPYIKHYCIAISLNSTSKFKGRNLPTILGYYEKNGKVPTVMSFAFAALLAFDRGTEIRDGALIGHRENGEEYTIKDDMPILEMYRDLWSKCDGSEEAIKALVSEVFSKKEMWDMDLNTIDGLCDKVSGYLYSILTNGVRKTMEEVVK